MKDWLIKLLVCLVIYEIIENLILPLIWTIRCRRRNSALSPSGMIGKSCVVKQWNGSRGKVWVGHELWNASSKTPLIPGTEMVVQGIKGLTLLISPPEMVTKMPECNSDKT